MIDLSVIIPVFNEKNTISTASSKVILNLVILLSVIFKYWFSEVSKKYGIIDSILHMDGNGGDYLIVPAGGSRIPASIDSVKNRSHFIKQDGKTVFKHAVKGMADVSKKILARNLFWNLKNFLKIGH